MGARGLLLAATCDALHGLEDEGLLERDVLLERLLPEDLAYLYTEVQPDRWYPIETVDRISCLVRDQAGENGSRILIERGRAVALELLERPIVHEMNEARGRTDAPESWWSRAGHLLVALPSSLFTHASWKLHPDHDPGRFTLEVTEAEGLPETARIGLVGALEELAARVAGRSIRVTSERPQQGRIVFQGRPARRN